MKSLQIFAIVLFLTFSLSIIGHTSEGIGEFCTENEDMLVYDPGENIPPTPVSHGTCVECYARGFDGTFISVTPSCLCNALKDIGLLEFFGWENVGQCVKANNVFWKMIKE